MILKLDEDQAVMNQIIESKMKSIENECKNTPIEIAFKFKNSKYVIELSNLIEKKRQEM